MDARVILTDKTKKEMNKVLTKHHKGALLARRLKEVAENGKLSQARTRFDVARLVGYTEGQRASGYAWVKRMIKIGVLSETLDGLNEYGKANYQFFYNGVKTESKKKEQTVEPVETIEVAETPIETKVTMETTDKTILTLYHGETTLAIEGASGDTIIEIVKTIVK